jgi:hypothetical protein
VSRSFSNVASSFNFNQVPNVSPIQIGKVSGASAPLFINWANYSTVIANIGLNVDLSIASVQKALATIKSIYIDNMGSSAAIYIQFPDTGYTIVAQANSAGWFPVYTNQFKFTIFALGIDPTNVPQTKILVTNVPVEASTDIELATAIQLWKSSPLLARTGALNPQLGTPALGDQFTSGVISLQTDGATQVLFGTPLASGNFIYITSVNFTIQSYTAPGTSAAQNRLFFESTGSAGIFFEEDISAAQSTVIQFMQILNMQGQWKLDASQTYRLRNQVLQGPGTGAWNASFSYTITNS